MADNGMKLSWRLRPNSECAPWVVGEVEALEGRVLKLESTLRDLRDTFAATGEVKDIINKALEND